jgi:hypothetical protein
LWPGAAAAGWSITMNKMKDTKTYTAPDGRTFQSRFLAAAHKVVPRLTLSHSAQPPGPHTTPPRFAVIPSVPRAVFVSPRVAPGPSSAAAPSPAAIGTLAVQGRPQQPGSSASHASTPPPPSSRKRGAHAAVSPASHALIPTPPSRKRAALAAMSPGHVSAPAPTDRKRRAPASGALMRKVATPAASPSSASRPSPASSSRVTPAATPPAVSPPRRTPTRL